MPTDAPTSYRTIDAKSITRIAGNVDSWFLSRYGMNLYRGCAHGCTYCDGRAEKYYVEGDFARDVVVKRNAVELLQAELPRAREPGFVVVGGGVSDAYQPIERELSLARGALQVVRDCGLPVHVLTKSNLVARDFDLIDDIHRQTRAIVACSIQTVRDEVRAHFEPQASSIADRFALLEDAKRRGYATGVMAMPVLPGISDRQQDIDALVDRCVDAGVDFVLPGGLTLRPGVQKRCHFDALQRYDPCLLPGYVKLFAQERKSGIPLPSYLKRVEDRFHNALARTGLPSRIPRRVFHNLIPVYAECAVLLDHEAYHLGAHHPLAKTLAQANHIIQNWARECFAKHARKKGFCWQQLEQSFRWMLMDGSIGTTLGLSQPVVDRLYALVGIRPP